MKSQLFKHIKTQRVYRVIEVGKDVETHEELVIYVCAADVNSQVWIRPMDLFNEKFQPVDISTKVDKPLATIGFVKRDEIAEFYQKLKS